MLDKEELEALAALKRQLQLLEDDEAHLSPSEIATLRMLAQNKPKLEEIIAAWATVKAWGKLGKLAIWIILTIGSISVALSNLSYWFKGGGR